MPNQPAIRVSVPGDAQQLATLDATSWPAELQVSAPQAADQPFFTAWREPQDVLVADRDATIIGYIRLGRHLPIAANDHVLHIDALVVAPGARGGGIGSLLVDAAVVEARRRGVAKLGLRALSNNPRALALYAGHGFVEEGRLRAELRRPDGSYADDVWMALWLDELPGSAG